MGGHVHFFFFIHIFREFPRFAENLWSLYLTEIWETLSLPVLEVGSSLCFEVATQFNVGCLTFATLKSYIGSLTAKSQLQHFYLWWRMLAILKLCSLYRQELETDSTNFWWLRVFRRKKAQRRRTIVSRPKQMSLKEKPSIELIPNTAPQRERPILPRRVMGSGKCYREF